MGDARSGHDRQAEGRLLEDAGRAGEVPEGVPGGPGGAAEGDLPDAAGAAGEEHGVLPAAAVLGAAHGAAAAGGAAEGGAGAAGHAAHHGVPAEEGRGGDDAEAVRRDAAEDAEGDGEVRGRDAAAADD